MRASLKAEEEYAAMQINEIEEYLGLMREKQADIHLQVAEAEEQVGLVHEVLESDGIPEVSLSDDEDSSSSLHPTPPDYIDRNLSSLDTGGSNHYMSPGSYRRSGTPDSGSSSLAHSHPSM